VITPDKQYLCAVAEESIIVLATNTWAKVNQTHSEYPLAYAAASSPAKNELAVGFSNGDITIYGIPSLSPRRKFVGNRTFVYSLAFSAGGSHLLSGGGDQSVRLWEEATGLELLPALGHRGPVTYIAFVGSDRLLSASSFSDRSLACWNVASRVAETWYCLDKPLTAFQHYSRLVAHFAKDRWFGYFKAAEQKIEVIDVMKERPIRSIDLGDIPVSSILVSENATEIVVGGQGTVTSIGCFDQRYQINVGRQTWISALAMAPQEGHLAVGGDDGIIEIYAHNDLWRGDRRRVIEVNGRIESMAFVAGSHLFVHAQDSLSLWNVDRRKCVYELDETADAISVSARAGEAAVAGPEGRIRIIDLWDGKTMTWLGTHGSRVHALAYSADGTLVASGGSDTTIVLWPRKAGA
jgi:WD40 repeat protein